MQRTRYSGEAKTGSSKGDSRKDQGIPTSISIQPPSSRALQAFRNKFHNLDASKEGFPTLGGRSTTLYDEKNDLVSLSKPSEEDRLTAFVRHAFPWLFVKRRTSSPLTYISERRLQICVVIINIILTFALLFGAIYHLYKTNNNGTKLGLIAFYTVLFAICVGLVTNAKRSEVFGACAAYAAVLVVFVSGNIGSGTSSSNG
ncbi:hypothetical protein BDZ45DRAFT_749197 [Acephala macrosclerotiorum]|nr:hypothetical protein BDZ45DRAFT_749197 [Acephala macrosclerotiorum]